ncbi:flavin-containing monooxygenase [Nocardia sp. NPDC003482]
MVAELDVEVAVVGAGFGGIGMGVALREAGVARFVILEEADDLGGVWRDNTYPGCACDVPSHLYSFSFAPYRSTSCRYPAQPEILDYLRGVAREHGLEPHLRFRSRVETAVYQDGAARWEITTRDGARIRADVVVFAAGQLHRPHVPDIPGRESFAGAMFHSAAWDHDCDPTGLDVGVIGTGSSAAQLLPDTAARARRVTVYQRTPHWVLPKPAADFGPLSRAALRLPGAHRMYRRALYTGADLLLAPIMRRGWSARPARALARMYLRRSISDPELRAALTPDYPIGGKRILFDSAYYPTLTRPNVELVTDPIARITPDGITTGDGRHRPADVIVFATGFRAPEFLVPMEVRGRGGRSLRQEWAAGAEAYMGLAVPGYPNAFLIAGPNSFTPAGSNPTLKEHQIAYIIDCLRWRERTGAAAIEVGEVAMRRYRRWLKRSLAATVWPDGVRSWYRHPSGRVTNPWPASTRAFARMLRAPVDQTFVPVAAVTDDRHFTSAII